MHIGPAILQRVLGNCFFVAALSCASFLSGCDATGLSGGASYTSLPTPDSVRGGTGFAENEYRIAPQDILTITVYQFPNLSRDAQVDGAGRVSMPLLGGVIAAGKTVSEFEAELTKRLGAKYLQSPQVSVFVKEAVGSRVTVDGAVKMPGVYPLKGKTTLLQALALAQGINDVGDSTITLTRVADEKRVSMRIDVAAIRAGQAPDPQVYGGDTIVVDESAARTGLSVLKTTVPAMIGLGVRAIP